MSTPEGILKKQVADALKALGVLHFRMQSGVIPKRGRYIHLCEVGTADYLVCNPDPCWIELKPPGQKTLKARAEAQHAFGERVKALGHRHAIVDSVAGLLEVLTKR